ncbi:hypothetical protein OPQ81_005690 [Rhizoctonia solani]|nr:hypothetical protein OPQ81_005690 [Rhizoctonia solani]
MAPASMTDILHRTFVTGTCRPLDLWFVSRWGRSQGNPAPWRRGMICLAMDFLFDQTKWFLDHRRCENMRLNKE